MPAPSEPTTTAAAESLFERGRYTIGELLDGAVLAVGQGRAREFLAAYRAVNPENADANLGYVLGYCEPPERRRSLYEAFGLTHPVFGGTP